MNYYLLMLLTCLSTTLTFGMDSSSEKQVKKLEKQKSERNLIPDTVKVELIPEPAYSPEQLKETIMCSIQEHNAGNFKKFIGYVSNLEDRATYISLFVKTSDQQERNEIHNLFTKTPIKNTRRFADYKGSSLWAPNTGKPQ